MTVKRGDEVKTKGRKQIEKPTGLVDRMLDIWKRDLDSAGCKQIEKPTGLERMLDIWKWDLDSAAFRTWDELQLRGICGSAAEKEDLVPTSRVK